MLAAVLAAVSLGSRADEKDAPPKDPPPKDRAAPADTVVGADGAEHRGTIHEVTDRQVVLISAGMRLSFPTAEVKEVRRAATKKLLDFARAKIETFEKSGKAADWKEFLDFLRRQEGGGSGSLSPERRRALRALVKLEPENTDARKELGQALLDGVWLEEEDVEKKTAEGMIVVDGKLLKKTSTTVKPAATATPKAYRIITGKDLTQRQLERYEKEREKRIASAESFLAQKRKEYEGVPWSQRHKVSTRNFQIECNSTLQVARAYGELMELIRAELAKMFPSRIRRNLRAPIFIYASQEDFMTEDDYGQFGGRGLGGYYVPPSQKIAAFHGTFGFTGTTFGVLCHEGTHYYQGLVLESFDNCPIWLIEGLAVYFGDGSTFEPQKKKIAVGGIPRDRLAHIQEKMAAKRHTPVPELVGMRRGFGGFSGSHYADSWALIYFLVRSEDKKGTKLMTEYWARGIEEKLEKRHFIDLGKKYYGDVETLQKEYEKYILALRPPPAGEVQGDYFVSDYFQFDIKRPGGEWEFFEDEDDKKLLVGIMHPASSAEVRVYYANNLEAAASDAYFQRYLEAANRQHKRVEHEKTKVAGLDGYKLTYVDDNKGVDLAIIIEGGIPIIEEKKTRERGPEDVTEYKLIQIDGVLTIRCAAPEGKGKSHARDFEAIKDSLTLTLTRRW
jgi:hypothetical protein